VITEALVSCPRASPALQSAPGPGYLEPQLRRGRASAPPALPLHRPPCATLLLGQLDPSIKVWIYACGEDSARDILEYLLLDHVELTVGSSPTDRTQALGRLPVWKITSEGPIPGQRPSQGLGRDSGMEPKGFGAPRRGWLQKGEEASSKNRMPHGWIISTGAKVRLRNVCQPGQAGSIRPQRSRSWKPGKSLAEERQTQQVETAARAFLGEQISRHTSL
jgi:hypothetical protein